MRRSRAGLWRAVVAATALAACGGPDEAPPATPPKLLANQLWDVWIASATIAPTSNGAVWDRGGSPPDPYVVYGGGRESDIRSDTSRPAWPRGSGVALTTAQLEGPGLTAQLMDSDFLADEPITPPRTFVLTDDQIRAGGFTVEGWGGAERVTFAIAPHQ